MATDELSPTRPREGNPLVARILVVVVALAMMATSVYLTQHFYAIHFPKSLVAGSLCDVSSFWNCDVATLSPLSNLFGIPTSYFGLLMAAIFLCGALFPRPQLLRTSLFLAVLNFLGCLILFSYSLLKLGGLCPGCTLYYLCSVAMLGLSVAIAPGEGFWRKAQPSWPLLGLYASLGLALAVGTGFYTYQEKNKLEEVAERLLADFNASPNFEAFDLRSPHRLASATENFADAPLRISLFSDFQCPVCKVLAEDILPKLMRYYHGRLNLQYFFYPMDSNCNHNINQPMHPMACEAAYLSHCAGKNFPRVHDALYASQNELSPLFMQRLANSYGLATCYHSEEAKTAVEGMILDGDKIAVKATPTLLINGHKLEGLLPLKFLIVLCDAALKAEAAKVKG